MSANSGQFIGKFRGVVTDTQDPQMLGRIKARVPDVFGDDESGWALPALPYAGNNVGLFLLPPAGANVWIEFEQGDPTTPIWTGCFWASGEVPASPAAAEKKVLRTDSATITVDDTSGAASVTVETTDGQKIKLDSQGISLETTGGQKITLASSGITLDNGSGAKIELTGASVKLNDQALEVT